MKPPEWVQDAVFYQIFPDRFCNGDPANDPLEVRPWDECPHSNSYFGGDLLGVLEKLDYLQELGITALYLTPIFEAPSNHKYDTEDYFQVDPTFGGNQALRELVEELHRRGIRIILDGVFNHCGETHPFFQDVIRQGRRSPYWDWFTISGDRPEKIPELNYAAWAGAPSLPEWNHCNPKVREYLLAVVRHWLREYGIDGWRLDTVEYLPPDFVREVYQATKQENPDAYLLGEVMGVATSWFKYGALDGVMHYKLWEALVHFFAEGAWDAQKFASFVQAMWRSYPLENNFSCYTLLGSHDKPRFLTLCRGDKRRLILAVAFLFAFPGAPAIYYGDEIGMEGEEDPDCRRTFPWDESRWDAELRETFRTMIRIRHETQTLRKGEPRFVAAHNHLACLARTHQGEEILALFNASDRNEGLSLSGKYIDLLTGELISGNLQVPRLGFKLLRRVG